MLETIILGAIQGIAEWLPVSSEGLLALAAQALGSELTLSRFLQLALFLHAGTTLAAIVYFWREIAGLLKALFSYRSAPVREKVFLRFLIIATLISGGLALVLFLAIDASVGTLEFGGRSVTLIIAILLTVTGIIQLKKHGAQKETGRDIENLDTKDSVLLGIAQGIAALPGISRSGITVAALLLRGVREESALAASFIMSIPLVLAGNLVLNFTFFSFSAAALAGLFVAFAFGLLTIHYLLLLARKINFGWFAIGFAVLMIAALFI